MQDNLREELIKQFPAEVVELVERPVRSFMPVRPASAW